VDRGFSGAALAAAHSKLKSRIGEARQPTDPPPPTWFLTEDLYQLLRTPRPAATAVWRADVTAVHQKILEGWTPFQVYEAARKNTDSKKPLSEVLSTATMEVPEPPPKRNYLFDDTGL